MPSRFRRLLSRLSTLVTVFELGCRIYGTDPKEVARDAIHDVADVVLHHVEPTNGPK